MEENTDILLTVVNNTSIVQNAALFNNNQVSTSTNTQNYTWNVTSFTFVNQQTVEIQNKLIGATSFTTSNATLTTLTFQGVCDALNTLGIGTFSTYTTGGNTYITVYTLSYVYGTLQLFNNINILSITFDNIANVPVASATSVSNWNTFFNTSVNAIVPFEKVNVVGNTVNLIGCYNLTVSANLFNSNQHIISISDNLTIINIQNQSFFNCNFLTTININNCSTIGDSSFASCEILSSVIMPKLTNIGIGAFNGIAITQILNTNFPLVTTISSGAFTGCLNLTTINLPSCLTIDDTAFDTCLSLTSVSLASVISIGVSAFSGCTALTNISLPSVISIGDTAMFSCTSLTTIYIPACLNLGSTTGDDGVFSLIIGNTITLTIPLVTSTDGDVVYLQLNNFVTLITT